MVDEREQAVVGVIEDNVVSRIALGRLLQAWGFEPALFDSAEAFVASPQNQTWLCLIMDVQLAAMSGIDLLRRLRAAGCGVPVIIISGNRTDTVREDAEEAGCAAFLWKPFSAETILSLLGSIARDDRTWSKGHVDECSVETAAQAVYSLRQSPDVTEEQV